MELDEMYLQQLVEALVMHDIQNREDEIVKELSKNVDWNDNVETTISRMSWNAAKTSACISVRAILSLLQSSGIISISEEWFHTPHLTVLRHENIPEE